MGYPDVETVNLKNCHFLWISTDNRFRGVLLLFSKGTSKYDPIPLRDIFPPPPTPPFLLCHHSAY